MIAAGRRSNTSVTASWMRPTGTVSVPNVSTNSPTGCALPVAYAIGKAHPVGLFVECFGTENAPVEKIQDAVGEVFDLRPAAIIRDLDLLRPIYAATSAYGHFGRELPDFTWERTDRVEDLRTITGLDA